MIGTRGGSRALAFAVGCAMLLGCSRIGGSDDPPPREFPQILRIGARADQGPSLAAADGNIYLTWRGAMSEGIWGMSYDGRSWTSQGRVSVAETSARPALAVFRGKVFAAWKAIGDDQTLWYASLDDPRADWSNQSIVPDVGSWEAPALGVWRDKLYLAWRGIDADPTIWWSAFDGTGWAPQQPIAGAATTLSPALAGTDEALYMAWKGLGADAAIWWARFDGRAWTTPRILEGARTTVGPALAADHHDLFVGWKAASPTPSETWIGFDGEQGAKRETSIWWARFDGRVFSRPRRVPEATTQVSPSLAFDGRELLFAWKGPSPDRGVYFVGEPIR